MGDNDRLQLTMTADDHTGAGSPGGDGGAIYNAGTLTVLSSTFHNNAAGAGGFGGATDRNVQRGSAGNGGSGGAIYNSGTLTIVNCGHMPPLLVDGTGARYVGEGGLMLGLTRHEPHVETAVLPVGGTALLFTDGLVEDRRVLLDDNLEKLRAVAAEACDIRHGYCLGRSESLLD